MAYEKNDKGQLLLNVNEVAAEVVSEYSRYNGGWTKRVTGLNKSVTDGYSIIGDFMPDKITWADPGLYLDCSVEGSRKNHVRWYTLFVLRPDGSAEELEKGLRMPGASGGDWAPRLWSKISKALSDLEGEPVDLKEPFVKSIREAFFKMRKLGLIEGDEFRTQYETKVVKDGEASHVKKELYISIKVVESKTE